MKPSGWLVPVLGLLLLLTGCASAPPADGGFAGGGFPATRDNAPGASRTRLAIVPLQGDRNHEVGEELAVRLLSMGYDVVDPVRVRGHLLQQARDTGGAECASARSLQNAFGVNGVVFGAVRWRSPASAVDPGGAASAELHAVEPDGCGALSQPVSLAVSAGDLGDPAASSHGDLEELAAFVGVGRRNSFWDYGESERHRLLVAALGRNLAQAFPHRESPIELPVRLALAWNRPEGREHGFFTLGDRLRVAVRVEDRHTALPEGARMELQVAGWRTLSLDRAGERLWQGSAQVQEKGVYLRDEPGTLYLAVGGRRWLLRKMGLFSIDTQSPVPRDLRAFGVDRASVRFSWKVAEAPDSLTHVLQFRRSDTDPVVDVRTLADPKQFETVVSRPGAGAWRVLVRDAAGNEGATPWMRPHARYGCFPVMEDGAIRGRELCIQEDGAWLRGGWVGDIRDLDLAENRCRFVHRFHRYKMTFLEQWDLVYSGDEGGWKGTVRRDVKQGDGASGAVSDSVDFRVKAGWF